MADPNVIPFAEGAPADDLMVETLPDGDVLIGDPELDVIEESDNGFDANLAEVISYQQEQPVPFFIRSPFSQSEDEKFQQNKILTEWLENIFIHGAIEKKEIDFLNG